MAIAGAANELGAGEGKERRPSPRPKRCGAFILCGFPVTGRGNRSLLGAATHRSDAAPGIRHSHAPPRSSRPMLRRCGARSERPARMAASISSAPDGRCPDQRAAPRLARRAGLAHRLEDAESKAADAAGPADAARRVNAQAPWGGNGCRWAAAAVAGATAEVAAGVPPSSPPGIAAHAKAQPPRVVRLRIGGSCCSSCCCRRP